MTTDVHTHPTANLDLFREKVVVALRQSGQLQKGLAQSLNINAQVLSRKLHGLKGTYLTHAEVKQIIRTLVGWDALSTQGEAIELLALMGLKAESFSEQEWKSAPLNRLTALPPTASAPLRTASVADTLPLLPAPSTPLLGREQDIQHALERLRSPSVRLLTLLGMGGVGKTRLALEVAHAARPDFADGVCFVSLATLYEADLVPSTIAQALRLSEPVVAEQSGVQNLPMPGDMLKRFLRDKALLLVLDNVEQIPSIGALLSDLLSAAPSLKIMVTSRSVLHLYGEHEFAVPPLAVCSSEQAVDLEAVSHAPAIRLFVERAQAINPAFQVTPQNAATLVHICARLDGLPLAIELAASRTKVLTLPMILKLLTQDTGQSLTFLHSRTQNALQRHQTLHDMLDWSYNLLRPEQQTLFRRLGVFLGGWTAQTARAVCMAERPNATFEEALAQIEALIDHSLVKRSSLEAEENAEPRFTFLETIRDYGLGQLSACEEREEMQRRHADFFLTLAQATEPDLASPKQTETIALLAPEQDNLRAALTWAFEHNEAECAQRMAAALGKYWEARTQFHEAHRWIDGALALPQPTPPAVRAKLLIVASRIALWEIACERARILAEEALALYETLDDAEGRAEAIYQIGDTWHIQGEHALATSYFEESVRFHKQHHNKSACGYAFALSRLGAIAVLEGNFAEAWTRLQEALPLLYEYTEPGLLAINLVYLGILALVQGEMAQSLGYLRDGLKLAQHINNRFMVASDLIPLGCLLGSLRDPSYAARVCSGAEALFASLNTTIPTAYRPLYDAFLGGIKGQVDATSWDGWWAEGKALSLEALCSLALEASDGLGL